MFDKDSLLISALITGGVGVILLIILICPLITWWLFNYLAPIFNIRQIHFLEAIALFILCNLLTSGFGRSCKCNGK